MGFSAIIVDEAIKVAKRNNNINLVWFDENINYSENQSYIKKIKPFLHSCLTYNNLEEGFTNFYSTNFTLIFTIVSGKLWERYLQLLMKNINKTIIILYTTIFTSNNFKEILLQNKPDEKHLLSYDSLNKINDPFYNPGGVISSYKELINKIDLFKIGPEYKINKRGLEKRDYEGIFTFEYLENVEDLLAPALYKEIITNEPIKDEKIGNLIEYFLSFNCDCLNN